MAKQYQIPGGPFVNVAEGGLEYALPGYGFLNEATVSSGQTIAVGQVTETDAAQSLVRVKTLTLGQASEVDVAQPLAWAPKHRLIGQASETDAAQSAAPPAVVVAEGGGTSRRRKKHRRPRFHWEHGETAPHVSEVLHAVDAPQQVDAATPEPVAYMAAALHSADVMRKRRTAIRVAALVAVWMLDG